MENNRKFILIGNLLALSAAICWGFNEPANKLLIPSWISASGSGDIAYHRCDYPDMDSVSHGQD